ncbi:MAG: flagellar motor switch protein FliG [Candidatus Eisenbacteria bacterium]
MSHLAVTDLTPKQRAAIVVMSIGPGAGDVLKELGGSVVEQLAETIVQLGDVPKDVRNEVLAEFHNRLAANQAREAGGLEKASAILEVSLGKAGANQVVQRIGWRANRKLMAYARRDPGKFAGLLAEEHPQTIAFILTQVEEETAGKVISALPEEIQPDLTWRVATMGEISPDVAGAVHAALAPVVDPPEGPVKRFERLGGEEKAAGLLNMVPLRSQKTVLETMAVRDQEIANRVRKLMFVFRDILLLDDRAMQRVLKEVDVKDLSMALKPAEDDVKQKIFKNVSERAAISIKEEMEYMGPVRPNEIEMAQDRIIDSIRSLEEKGEIMIERGEGGS